MAASKHTTFQNDNPLDRTFEASKKKVTMWKLYRGCGWFNWIGSQDHSIWSRTGGVKASNEPAQYF